MRLLTTSIILFFIGLNGIAQNFDNYQPLRSSGKVPSDFTERTSSKVAKDVAEEVSSTDKTRAKNAKSDFLLKANYMIDELLMSGKVLLVTKFQYMLIKLQISCWPMIVA